MEVRVSGERGKKSLRIESSARPPLWGRQEGSSSESELRSRPSTRQGRGPLWINQMVEEPRKGGRGQDVPREPVELRRGANEDNHPTRGIIHMISGGATDEIPGEPGKHMGGGHAIPPLGQIVLALSLGHEPRRITKMTIFSVVDTPSAYNGILGRLALKDFRAVASTYHQKLKFLVGRRVGVLCGDQKVARRCYEGIIKQEGKRARVKEVVDEEPEIIAFGPEKRTLRIALDLDPRVREELVTCLQANLNRFTWSAQELMGTTPDVAEHRLNILPNARPVKHKKRHFGTEKDKVIQKEVGKLMEAGHIREVQFPNWLSNFVLVPKSSGKWRMCLDFRDLNKGYHQILLAVEDQDKVNFITSERTFCYVVMPFRLKNAGATYQRLMDRVFSKQVGRNAEVYVNDIMVKSRDSTKLIPDLVETFSTLGSYGLKLNSQKCIFGLRSGTFLGYMVTERGIEANPEKVRAIQDMVSPRGPNDVQKFTRRIAALARFISRSAHRSLPFFRTLRKAKKFEWDPDCEKAFGELKKYLAEFPVLAKPAAGEPLCVYLSATEEAMSLVLVKLEGSTKQPVYYVSHALKGVEIRYFGLEKLALALVMTERRLRPYFLSRPIVVLTNSPLGKILTHCLAVWLSGLQSWESMTSRKWGEISTDFASWEEVTLAVRLDFRASNNEAEYEAMLAGLRAARYVGAARVLIFSDSQLVAQQMKGIYDLKNEKLIEYAQEVDRVREKFTEIIFEQIPRKENERRTEEEEEDWRTGIIDYPKEGKLPDNPREALDYFSKWVEAEPLARITENEVLKFLWKNIVCRYRGLKVRLGNANGNWVDELPSVLWAYRTTPREGTKETPFSLVYGNEAVLPAEIGLESARVIFYDEDNDARRATYLDLLEEKRETAIIHMEAYKNSIAQSYNRRVIQRNFQVDDLVLRKVQEEHRGKLEPKWEGPFKVI
ncbi:uncharacterized protein [Primulina eburnea]|uniref:uncharacterized protein n=1 Tax=Primulina eburnea TaxID=1245227 RepID=UPI003C6C1AA2